MNDNSNDFDNFDDKNGKRKTELLKSAQNLSDICRSHVNPFITTCYNCGEINATEVILKTGVFAWIITILGVLLFGPFGLVLLISECIQDAIHICPNCHIVLGESTPLFMKKMNH